MGKLPTCHSQHDVIAPGTDFAAAEAIATSLSLGCDDFEISIYRGAWRCMSTEALELRMMAVAPGSASEDGTRQQPLPPQGHQAPRVKVLWME
jgi:hypothetical protein